MSFEIIRQALWKERSEKSHLDFSRLFFKHRHGLKFRVNWHHLWICDEVERVLKGQTKNLLINVSPGSSKTELVVINLIARGLALNPRSRFLHLSYSDDLATLNSHAARELVASDQFQQLWPLQISPDTKSKKRWNVYHNGQQAGGVYATSLGGQITGFRAGHMMSGFNGAIIIDDPSKPEEAFSRSAMEQANRKLVTTVKSRKASPETPIIIIMQRISEDDVSRFITQGGLDSEGPFRHIVIPALLEPKDLDKIPTIYHQYIDKSQFDSKGRFSYWPYKEPLSSLLLMEEGTAKDAAGNPVSRHVFNSQYQQRPTKLGGNIIKTTWLKRWLVLPKIKYRMIYADTAQKTKEHNDFSVFQCWGVSEDNKAYLLDQIRGKWEAPELLTSAVAFWIKHNTMETPTMGALRQMRIEDKASGTGLIQQMSRQHNIPVKGIERTKDRLTRVMDAIPFMEAGLVYVPEEAPWLSDYLGELESFTPNDAHVHDDQVDPTVDAIIDLVSSSSKIRTWEMLA